LKEKDRPARTQALSARSQLAGIDKAEIRRRKEAGECLGCAWPAERKGNHIVRDCRRPIKLDRGTANFPKGREYQITENRHIQQELVQASSEEISLEGSSSDEL
jgi:hypothetical protein